MPKIYIGTAGWSIPRTHADRFPSEGNHLLRYAVRLNCVEINSCFYREHKLDTYRKWAASVPDDFSFAVKVPRAITHEGRLNVQTQPLLQRFLEQTGGLAEKRGPILFQTPPSLAFGDRTIRTLFLRLRQFYDGPAVVEPRHRSWFQAEAEEILRGFRIARVAADPALVPSAAHPAGWLDPLYFRLHGSPRRYYSPYPAEHIRGLAAELRQAAATASVWCIFDNTASGAALGNALDLNAS